MYKKITLDNGLRIIMHPMPRMQSVALGIWIRAGGRYESRENKGISHFLEHLVFKGTKNYSCRSIKESIEGVGGSLNGFTAEEMTCYLAKLPAPYLYQALDILSDIAINPVIPQAEVKKEKTVILEEIKMHKDLPQTYVYDLLDELLWPAQPLGMSIIGSSESVSRMERQDLYLYKESYYTPSNIVVSIAGLFEPDKVIKRVEKKFSRLKAKPLNTFVGAIEKQTKPALKLMHKDTEQIHLALGFHSFKRGHPLRYALGILNVILGANMSSRLFNEIREKRGLAYEIGTQVRRLEDTGTFAVHAGIDNRKVNAAIELILKELKKVKDNLVSADEFKRAKEFYLGQLKLALEDTLDHMLWIGESTVTLDKIYTLDEIIKQVNRIKLEDIRRVSRALFKDESLNVALIGPLKESEDKIYQQLFIG